MSWRDIGWCPATAPGVFSVEIAGGVRCTADQLGVRRVHLAMCTTRTLAAATVIVED